METTGRSNPPAARQRIRGILFAALVLGTLCVNAGVILYLALTPEPSAPAPKALKEEFEDRIAYGVRMSLPESWVYEQGEMGLYFASSRRELKDLPGTTDHGAGMLVFSTVYTYSDSQNIRKINEEVAAGLLSAFTVLEKPQRLNVDGYEAASAIYLFALDDERKILNTDGQTTVAYLTVVRREQELFRFFVFCRPEEWLEFRPTLEAIMESVEILPPEE